MTPQKQPDAPLGYRATWAEIDLDRIATNFAALRALAGRNCAVLPVVKANAYGHGATPIARRLETEGAAALCVGVPEEGLELRRAGITLPILCMGAVEPRQIVAAARSRITLALYAPDQLAQFEEAGKTAGLPVPFQLKIESGAGRLGVLPDELGPLLEALRSCRWALLSGLFSNLACADQPGDPLNAAQAEQLKSVAEAIRAAGHDPRPVHLANSAGILFHPALRLDAIRPGLLLYGVPPTKDASAPGFAPALSLRTTVLRVKSVPVGATVGYGATWRATRPSTLATIAIGYDDGLPRAASGKGEVLIGGHRAPLAGLVAMDLAVVDVTDLEPVEPGAEVVVLGTQGSATIGAWELAERAGTVPWELLCGIGRRVTRVHRSGGEVTSSANPLPSAHESLAPPVVPAKPKWRDSSNQESPFGEAEPEPDVEVPADPALPRS